MVNAFILLANICLPATAVFLSLKFPSTPFRWWFSLLITAHVAIRMWETFFTSREKDPRRFAGDWTLAVGTFAYIGLCFVITFEFFLIPRERFFSVSLVGLVLYIFAARLRWWGQITLGKQWAIHVVGEGKIKKNRLLQLGPYEFIRHPAQLYEALVLSVFLLAALWLRRRLAREGDLWRLFLGAYSFWRLLIDAVKPYPRMLGLNPIQWAAMLALILLVWERTREHRQETPHA